MVQTILSFDGVLVTGQGNTGTTALMACAAAGQVGPREHTAHGPHRSFICKTVRMTVPQAV